MPSQLAHPGTCQENEPNKCCNIHFKKAFAILAALAKAGRTLRKRTARGDGMIFPSVGLLTGGHPARKYRWWKGGYCDLQGSHVVFAAKIAVAIHHSA